MWRRIGGVGAKRTSPITGSASATTGSGSQTGAGISHARSPFLALKTSPARRPVSASTGACWSIGMCLEQWMYASSIETTTQRSGVFLTSGTSGIAVANGSRSKSGANAATASLSTIVAVPLTCRPTAVSKKSTISSPTYGFSEMFPIDAITPLPLYSGHMTVFSSITRMNPGGPARNEESHSPWESAVAMKAIVMRDMNSRISGVR